MPNGNVLANAWEVKTKEECIALGLDPEKLPDAGLWFDKVIEIEPQGLNGGKIVWEWRMWDHLIQDIDPSKPNYGVASNYPRKLNLILICLRIIFLLRLSLKWLLKGSQHRI